MQSDYKNLKDEIISEINDKGIVPRSRLVFTCYEALIWALWLSLVIVGSVAVAIAFSVATYHQYALYELTHDNTVTFIIDALPLLWLSVIFAMTALAMFNLKHTKHGYRYSMLSVFGGSIVISLLGGLSLHLVGMGFAADNSMGQMVGSYKTQGEIEQNIWQQPQKGRLVGFLIEEDDVVVFKDVAGETWQLSLPELGEADLEILNSKQKVRLVGMLVGIQPPRFHVCGAFPWVYDLEHTASELYELKVAIKERIQRYRNDLQIKEAPAEDSFDDGFPCASMPFFKGMVPVS